MGLRSELNKYSKKWNAAKRAWRGELVDAPQSLSISIVNRQGKKTTAMVDIGGEELAATAKLNGGIFGHRMVVGGGEYLDVELRYSTKD